ncbi:hypothetical protein [Aquabacterium humicola]|uniref:hypothetical protein n=1 Tax=Aquabacterium humicola TaxID=3237377 RepID=UPI0025427201|nr:hypothetical protein [Rubrivivax pictus]
MLTDELAIKVSVYFSVYLALCSVQLAVVAERRGENNLYLSAGFILGCCALVPISTVASISLMLVGAGVVLLLRRQASEA